MRSQLLVAMALALVPAIVAGPGRAEDNTVLKDNRDKVSYGIGLGIGTNLKRQAVDVDPDVLGRGIRDAMTGAKPLMSDNEVRAAIGEYQKEWAARQPELMKQQGEKSKKEGEAFLAENRKKEGVVTLPSGLQYKVIKTGTGKKPKATDTVEVNYRGTLIDGHEFDSSYERGKPVAFQVNRVIPGWTEALQRMPVGSKWQLFIPSDLAYGERGAGQEIPPNSTLVFEVELLGIQPSAEGTAGKKKPEGHK